MAVDQARRVIWDRPARAAKGPVPSLTRDEIARTAVGIADAEGLDAVSIRRVSMALGVGAASLYRYVDNKDELFDLMVDATEGEDAPPPALTGDWRRDLSAFGRRTRDVMIRHPWLSQLAAGRPGFGPNALAWTEHGLAAMDPLALGADDRLIASEVLISFVRGFVTRELAQQQGLQRSGMDADAWARTMESYVERLLSTGLYPRFSEIVRDAELPHEESRDELFEAGLRRVLDGISP